MVWPQFPLKFSKKNCQIKVPSWLGFSGDVIFSGAEFEADEETKTGEVWFDWAKNT